MIELTPAKADKKASKDSTAWVRSSLFKYYIHDGMDAFRFQLLGELTEADVSELDGCWRTAKTTLGNRKLVFDLLKLKAADEPAREWLISMANEGATYLPETYLRHGLTGEAVRTEPTKAGLFCKLLRSSDLL